MLSDLRLAAIVTSSPVESESAHGHIIPFAWSRVQRHRSGLFYVWPKAATAGAAGVRISADGVSVFYLKQWAADCHPVLRTNLIDGARNTRQRLGAHVGSIDVARTRPRHTARFRVAFAAMPAEQQTRICETLALMHELSGWTNDMLKREPSL